MRTTARRSPLRKVEKISRLLSFLAGAYGDIFFVGNAWFGALILCCTFLVPNIGMHGLLAGLCALGLIRAVDPVLPDSIFARAAACNSVLMGLYFGSLFKLSPAGLPALFAATLGILAVTGLVTSVLARRGLPALSLPFSIVGFVTFLWGNSIASLISYKPYLLQEPFPPVVLSGVEALAALIKTLGSIIFLPGVAAGIAVLAFLLFYSRLQLILVCYGLFLATLSQVVFYGLIPGAAHYSTPFNIVLTSVALGGIFISFSRASVSMATAGVFFAVVIEGAFYKLFSSTGDISPLTFPFCISAILILDFVKTYRPQWLPAQIAARMETTAELHNSRQERFGAETPVLDLPILREVSVMQGIDGEWTHVGLWRFALDFFITDPIGKSYRLDPSNAGDYHIFGAQVVSPCDGEVVRVENERPDNKIGRNDLEYSWGNYVIIRTTAGQYVLLAHLQRRSIKVGAGSWVYAEQPVALVGNSGHSHEPHLHLQVQASALLGAPTMPFRFKTYQSGREIYFFTIPRKGMKASPLPFNKILPYSLGLKLGQELHFTLEKNGKKTNVNIKVRLDERTGQWFFGDERNGRLSFWNDRRSFYVYDLQCSGESPLNLLLAALPRLPLTFGCEYRWKDRLPLAVTNRGLKRILLQILDPFSKTLRRKRDACYRLDPTGMRLSGQILFFNRRVETLASLDPAAGIKEISVGQAKLTREAADFTAPAVAASGSAG